MTINEKPIRGSGRIAVLARKEEIAKRIEQGYPVKWIYRDLKEKLNMCYGQFARYVRTYITVPKEKITHDEVKAEPEMSEEERLYHEKMAIDDMLNLCDKLVVAFVERQDWLPEKYGRLAGIVKGFSVAER